jgi:Helix-hairpin-helix motif/Prokaryotic membrane lipoprotein lipid attachment site
MMRLKLRGGNRKFCRSRVLEPRRHLTPGALFRIKRKMKRILFFALIVVGLAGCTPEKRSPDEIRRETAAATAEAARDTKAVAKGVVEGLREKGPININKASADDLETLPGIDEALAEKIIAGRPYEAGAELYKRHIVSKAEYDRIANRVVAR